MSFWLKLRPATMGRFCTWKYCSPAPVTSPVSSLLSWRTVALALTTGVALSMKSCLARMTASEGTRVRMRPARRSPNLPGKIWMVLEPRSLMFSSTCCCAPCPRATTLTTEAMPMMMPSMVRKARSLWPRMARHAMLMADVIRPAAPKTVFLTAGAAARLLLAASPVS